MFNSKGSVCNVLTSQAGARFLFWVLMKAGGTISIDGHREMVQDILKPMLGHSFRGMNICKSQLFCNGRVAVLDAGNGKNPGPWENWALKATEACNQKDRQNGKHMEAVRRTW